MLTIQEVEEFEKLVNGLRNKDNVDVYVTGSNAKLLSKEISTIFRDRGQEMFHPYHSEMYRLLMDSDLLYI